MSDKTLALIMAAGYGTRMGPIGKPKAMLLDQSGRPFIEDAFTFLRYQSDFLDFAVLSRDEEFFKPLNDYLHSHYSSDVFSVLHQKVEPNKFHVMAIFLEYFFRRGEVHSKISEYANIIVLPADHKLTADDLNLEDLLEAHQHKSANLTLVFSEGWGSNPAYQDVISTDEYGKITYLQRVDPASYKDKENFKRVTSTGVWVIRRNIFDNPSRLAAVYAGFRIGTGITAGIASAFAYMIKPGWNGLRDTPLDLERELIS